jgi:hypothetical protein
MRPLASQQRRWVDPGRCGHATNTPGQRGSRRGSRARFAPACRRGASLRRIGRPPSRGDVTACLLVRIESSHRGRGRPGHLAGRLARDRWIWRALDIQGVATSDSRQPAKGTGVREHRSVAIGDATPVVDRSRFDASGAWMSPPQHWVEDSENRVLAEGLADRLHATLERLPARQREVLLLRDVEGLSSPEICEVSTSAKPTSGSCSTAAAVSCVRRLRSLWRHEDPAARR